VTEIDPKLSRLYRETSTEDPSPAIDAAILAAAKNRVSKSQRQVRSLWSRWMLPVSAMATLVLGISITFLVEREHPETTDDSLIRQSAPRAESPPTELVTESVKAKTADGGPAAVSAKNEVPAVAAPANAPVPRPAELVPSATSAPSADFRSEKKLVFPVAPNEAAPALPSIPGSFPVESRTKATEPRRVGESNVSSGAAARALGAAPAAASADSVEAAPMRLQETQRSPEAWLDDIRRLNEEGRVKEAEEQLVQFRKAYPAHPIPENLLK